MTLTIDLAPDEQSPTVWPLQSFLRGEFASVGSCELQLDRSNAEFGLLHRLEDSTFIVAQYPDNDEPVYFHASWALAVCYRSMSGACTKVCVQTLNYQIDLDFEHFDHAHCFVAALKSLASNALTFYEAPGLCLRSKFFANACKPGFMESETKVIQLEEDASTVEALLAEIYGVENPITSSIFTTFALQPNIKKEFIMNSLLSLFVAADKYDLDSIRIRAAGAFVDRLPYMHDPLVLLDLANFLLDNVPERDLGLRSSMIRYVQTKLPAIMRDHQAEAELAQNALVYMALLRSFSKMIEDGSLVVSTKSSSGLPTPPISPAKAKKFNAMGLRRGGN
ncbi:hypothetical protein N0V90_002393 [Kalmusia sp. IMI 367209]|nr:hypothetical protein N0V90_002393 [Kalmusia sp. IMI 367209]